MVSYLILTIIGIYQVNSEPVQCLNSNSCSCQIPGLCQLYCTGLDDCKGSNVNIFCHPNYPCEIYCGGKSSCSEATIHNNNAIDVSLICYGTDSCKGSSGELNCGTGSCLLNCDANTACEDLGINTNNAKSFHCIGFCPNNVPNDYTSGPTYSPTNNPTPTPTITPTMIPTNNPTYNPSSKPTTIPTITPSIAPSIITIMPTTIPSLMPTVSLTYYPSLNPISNYTSITITLECRDSSIYIGKCDIKSVDKNQNIYIDVSYSFSDTIIYNLHNMECFLYNIFIGWFGGLKYVNDVNLCTISNVFGGIQITDDRICDFLPCLINIDTYNTYNVNTTITIFTTNTETYSTINDLKFRLMRKELQNIFMDTFNINIHVTINLDYIGDQIKSQQLNGMSMHTFTIIWVIVLIIGIILCIVIYYVYKSCILRKQLSKNVKIVKPVNSVSMYRKRIRSQSNINPIQLQSPLSIGSIMSVKLSPSQNIVEDDVKYNDCLNHDKDIDCSNSISDHVIDTNTSIHGINNKDIDDGIDTNINNITNGEEKHDIDHKTDNNEISNDLRNYFNAAMNAMMHDIDVLYEDELEHGENDHFIRKKNSLSIQLEGIKKRKNDTLM